MMPHFLVTQEKSKLSVTDRKIRELSRLQSLASTDDRSFKSDEDQGVRTTPHTDNCSVYLNLLVL